MVMSGKGDVHVYLNRTQYVRAFDWAGEHLIHIDLLISDLDSGYPPSEEDLGNPALWKPEHWFWFLKNL